MPSISQYRRWAWSFTRSPSQKKLLLGFSSSSSAPDLENTRPAPPPIRVMLTESAGRGVFSTRRIGAGDLIHTARPFVSHPSLSNIHSVCYLCLKKLQNSTTLQVHGVSFCSEDCREHSQVHHEVESKVDWLAYDDYCRTRGLKYPLMVKRLACMVVSGAASADSLDILQPAVLSPPMISEMEEGFRILHSAFVNANITKEQMSFVTKQWYISVLARIRINAFRIELAGGSYEDLLSLAAACVDAEAAVGNAVYILPSFYNHDCDPNTHIVWIDNANARLKALRDIETGEELRICYIDASMDRDARQSILSEGFGFECNCPRCSSGE